MKEIKLTKGQTALVDDEDYEYLNQWKWYANKAGRNYYAERIICKPKRINLKMHRLLMKTPKGFQVDHIDHNGLNNQKNNLRNCSFAQNQMNKIMSKNSKYLGLSHFTCNYKGKEYFYIKATIMVNRKKIHLGCFKTDEEAAYAFDKAAVKYRGEFANLNFKQSTKKEI